MQPADRMRLSPWDALVTNDHSYTHSTASTSSSTYSLSNLTTSDSNLMKGQIRWSVEFNPTNANQPGSILRLEGPTRNIGQLPTQPTIMWASYNFLVRWPVLEFVLVIFPRWQHCSLTMSLSPLLRPLLCYNMRLPLNSTHGFSGEWNGILLREYGLTVSLFCLACARQ